MFQMRAKLEERERSNRPIRLGLIGCGKMGRSLVIQLQPMAGFFTSVIVDHTPQKGVDALRRAGVDEAKILVTEDVEAAARFLAQGGHVVSGREALAWEMPDIDVVVEATGIPEAGARIALATFAQKKHLVTLNVECDSAVGTILLKKAREAGVVYTGTKGDEPGAIVELAEFATNLGLDIVAVGKGKNNKLDRTATPASLAQEAKERGLSPRMLCSFVDGSNTMTELASAGNALGLVPDVPNCHGLHTNPQEISSLLQRKEQGGILENTGVLEYAFGMAPGVFVIVTTEQPELQELLAYLGLGDGPNYTLFRPYHLTSMETPITLYKAVEEGVASLAPWAGPCCEAITIAKRDAKAGELVGGIGSEMVYGGLVDHAEQQREGLLPIALIDAKTTFRRDVKKGTRLCYEDVCLAPGSILVQLRNEQDALERS